MARSIFLDTSIQIRRVTSNSLEKAKIAASLQDKEITSSTYVLMELRRTILKDLCFVSSCLQECRYDQNPLSFLRETLNIFFPQTEHFTEISTRRAQRAIELIIAQFDSDEKISLDELIDKIRWWIEELEYKFTTINNENGGRRLLYLHNETDCDLAKGPFAQNPRKMMCIGSEAQCQLPDFINNNKSQFLILEGAIRARGIIQLQRYLNERERHKNNTELAKGQESCWLLAEAIKSVESPPDSHLFTSEKLVRLTSRFLNKLVQYFEDSEKE